MVRENTPGKDITPDSLFLDGVLYLADREVDAEHELSHPAGVQVAFELCGRRRLALGQSPRHTLTDEDHPGEDVELDGHLENAGPESDDRALQRLRRQR